MKKVFLIMYFDTNTGRYAGTLSKVFASEESAKCYLDKLLPGFYNHSIVSVDFIS